MNIIKGFIILFLGGFYCPLFALSNIADDKPQANINQETEFVKYIDNLCYNATTFGISLYELNESIEIAHKVIDKNPELKKYEYLLAFIESVRENDIGNSTDFIQVHTKIGNKLLAENRIKDYVRLNKEYINFVMRLGLKKEGMIHLLENEMYVNRLVEKDGIVLTIENANSLGFTYSKLNLPDSAEKYYLLALERANKINDSIWIGLVSGNLGSIYKQRKEWEKAKILLKTDWIISLKYGNNESAINALLSFADIEIEGKNIKSAKQLLSISDSLISTLNSTDLIKIKHYQTEYIFRMAKIAQSEGVNILADENYKTAIQLEKDVIENIELNNTIKLSNRYLNESKIIELQTYKILRNNFLIFFVISSVLVALIIIQLNRNIKLLKQKTEEINSQAQELTKLNSEKNKFFSIIAHDLRSPLNNLYAVLELQKKGLIDEHNFSKFIENIKESLMGCLTLFDNLINWAKLGIEKGSILNVSTFSANEVIQEIFTLKKTVCAAKNINLQHEITDHRLIHTDIDFVKLVLRNFLQNAIKFSPVGSIIHVKVSPHAEHKNNIVISVQDQGMGMPEEKANRLFTNMATDNISIGTAGEKGSGVGLFICKEFADKIGATLMVKSSLGMGSTFSIEIPAA